MISEYERARIAERTRRGTLHRARAGTVAVLSRAPYGYRYICKSEHAVPTRTGAAGWSQSTIWGMLRNPAYAGQAAYGKTRLTEKRARLTRSTRQRGERHGGPACERVESEQWIHIPVPALIDEQTFALAQKQLTGQAALAAQHPPAVAVAGDSRVRGLRLRLLPQ